MFLSIRELLLHKVRFEETFQPGAIEFFDRQVRQAGPLEVTGTAELSESTMEIGIRGSYRVRMEADCDRCLEPAGCPIEASFNLIYRPLERHPRDEEVEIDEGEAEVAFYQGAGLELADLLREQIMLALPMQRICREDCKGICPVCGQNRNLVACTCHLDWVDDRWAGLRKS